MFVTPRRLVCMGLLAALTWTASASPPPSQDVQLQIERLWAVTEVQNLLGTYSLWHTSGFNHRVPDLFTHTDDTVIEMMWGRYTGRDAAYRCYFVDHRRDDQNTIDALHLHVADVSAKVKHDGPGESPGGASTGSDVAASAPFHLHSLTTPVVVVAGDGQTARAVWISPGVEGSGWGYMKYGADFKKVAGSWKIWHLHVYGLFIAPYDRSWATNGPEAPMHTPAQNADKPATTYFFFTKDTRYIPLQPEPPQPYQTFGEKGMSPGSYGVVN